MVRTKYLINQPKELQKVGLDSRETDPRKTNPTNQKINQSN